MIRLEINTEDHGAAAGIAALIRACQDRAGLHEAMAQGVEGEVKDHLRGLNSRSPNTGYYGRAADSTEVQADEDGGVVRITERGMALHYYGGRVVPGKGISSFTGEPTKSLAIPTEDVPRSGREGRKGPREMGILAFLPSKRPGTVGVLVEGVEVKKKDGGTRTVRKDGGKLLFVLRSWTDHPEDPTVLPSISDMIRAAMGGAKEFLAATTGGSLT